MATCCFLCVPVSLFLELFLSVSLVDPCFYWYKKTSTREKLLVSFSPWNILLFYCNKLGVLRLHDQERRDVAAGGRNLSLPGGQRDPYRGVPARGKPCGAVSSALYSRERCVGGTGGKLGGGSQCPVRGTNALLCFFFVRVWMHVKFVLDLCVWVCQWTKSVRFSVSVPSFIKRALTKCRCGQRRFGEWRPWLPNRASKIKFRTAVGSF